ncbi:MAG: HAMP domain-containing histidine kinase, partial [Bacteroidetes bacterium]|nr:HAMP domain-containing histidine kinase [Bacteroidota bacterium]
QEEYTNLLNSILEDAERLKSLSNGLLELAQAEADKMAIRMSPVRIDEALFTAQRDIMKPNPERSVEISFAELPEEESALIIMGNEGMLRTLFLNLLENACKFSSDHKASVTIRFMNLGVQLSFEDNGPGIPEEEHAKIFMPFYRTENTRSYHGHGLGLSICSRIVKLHGGSISVASTMGQGSNFMVKLPYNI